MGSKINRIKALANVEAYLSRNDVFNIIKICNLYPINTWRQWTDLMGNSINIINKNKIKSTSNSLENNERTVTDLYYRSPPAMISKMSKWAFISFGRGNNNINVVFIWFLGKDERLRLLSITDDKWNVNQPPLMCGLDTLRPIIRNLNIDNYCRADILRVVGPDAAKITRSWATIWPSSDSFKNEILSFNHFLGSKIIKDCEV